KSRRTIPELQPKYSAIPPQTPPTHLSVVERVKRRVGAVMAVLSITGTTHSTVRAVAWARIGSDTDTHPDIPGPRAQGRPRTAGPAEGFAYIPVERRNGVPRR